MRYVSIALFRRNGEIVFKPPHKEIGNNLTQARKAATRYWSNRVSENDRLVRIFVVDGTSPGSVQISERAPSDHEWAAEVAHAATLRNKPHLVACLREFDIYPNQAPEPPPAVLIINGWTYRRDETPQEI